MAGDNYCARIPKSPNFTFLIDISRSSSENHVAYYALSAVKDFLLSRSNEDPEISFSLILYDQHLHLVKFDTKSQDPCPSLLTLNPTTLEPTYNFSLNDFTNFLSDFDNDKLTQQFDILIEDLPQTCISNTADWTMLKSIINHVSLSIRNYGGKICLVHGSESMYVPKLKKDPTKRGFFNNNDTELHKISGELHRSMGYMDLFLFGRGCNKNVSSLGEMTRLAGGDVFLYKNAEEGDLVNFYNDMVHSCSKSQTWETVFRMRNSSGWQKHGYGNFFISNFSDLLKIEGVDENYSMFYKFSPDPKRPPNQTSNFFFIQTSLLFTDSRRRRLLRINNYAVPMAVQSPEIYMGMDYQSTTCGLVKQSIIQMCSAKPLTDIQIELVSKFKAILKQMCIGTDQDYQADQMAFMGLAFLVVYKNLVFRAQHYTDYKNPIVDRINYLKVSLNKMNVDSLFKQFNPLLFDLSDQFLKQSSSEEFEYPEMLELSWESVAGKPLVVMDDGLNIFIIFDSATNVLCARIFRYLFLFHNF